jgi:ABC-type transport system involved in multi-copper enzyme maturation permease subunit
MLNPLAWTAFHGWRIGMGWQEAFEPVDVQNFLVGLPLVVVAIFLGVRVIVGEVDARRLEIACTVPGGSQRVWIAKLLAAWGILIVASALFGALQSATFYLVLSMGLAAPFKSEVTGAMVSIVAVPLASSWPAPSPGSRPFGIR